MLYAVRQGAPAAWPVLEAVQRSWEVLVRLRSLQVLRFEVRSRKLQLGLALLRRSATSFGV